MILAIETLEHLPPQIQLTQKRASPTVMKFIPCKLRRSPMAHAFTITVILAALFPALARAQSTWDGQGVSTGNGNTDIDNTGNWSTGTITGNFTRINQSPGTLYFTTASTPVSSLDFGWATNGLSLTLDATDSGDAINLASGGAIYLPNVTTASSVITLTSNVTLNLGTGFTATDTIGYHTGATGNVSNAVVINALVTGSAGSGGSLQIPYVSGAGAPIVELNNNSNSFDAPINVVGGYLFYTSVGNVNGGNSALGDPTTTAHGTIAVGNGDALIYDGTSSTTSNRILSLSGAGYVINDSSSATTQTFSSNITVTSSGNTYSFDAVNSGSELDLTGVIPNAASGTENVRTDISLAVAGPSGTPTVGAATGTVEFANAANTYIGTTAVDGGTLILTKLANGGLASSIGESSNVGANLELNPGGATAGAILSYQGTGDSTDRLFEIRGKTEIDSSGSGALDFTNTGAITLQTATPSTLTLGGTYAGSANTMAPIIGDYNSSNKTSLVISGAGKWILSNANTYTGGTTVSAGTLLLGNGSNGSATGGGTVTVAPGATIGGSGTGLTGVSTSTTFTIGSATGAVANVIVGNGTDNTSSLEIAATGALVSGNNGTVTNANLTFNLASTSTSANLLNLGATAAKFTSTTLTLNLQGANIVAPDTAYVLITDSAGFNASTDGLTITNGVITGGLSIAPNSFFGAPVGGYTTGFYNGSYLFVSGDNIEVEVVPEPSAWALMLGGLALLVFWQRRKATFRA
jgi:fibronectin-binding autotransporter adhesin